MQKYCDSYIYLDFHFFADVLISEAQKISISSSPEDFFFFLSGIYECTIAPYCLGWQRITKVKLVVLIQATTTPLPG